MLNFLYICFAWCDWSCKMTHMIKQSHIENVPGPTWIRLKKWLTDRQIVPFWQKLASVGLEQVLCSYIFWQRLSKENKTEQNWLLVLVLSMFLCRNCTMMYRILSKTTSFNGRTECHTQMDRVQPGDSTPHKCFLTQQGCDEWKITNMKGKKWCWWQTGASQKEGLSSIWETYKWVATSMQTMHLSCYRTWRSYSIIFLVLKN